MRILLLLALLVLGSASVEAFWLRGSGPSPSGIAVPAPAAAVGFTTLALNADFTQPMPSNWLGGCAVAGNGASNNTSDNTGHTWYLNYWWSSTYQNCNTVQATDPDLGGTVLDIPWATDSANAAQGTVVESASWNYNPGVSGETHDFPHNAYYEIEARNTPIVAGVYMGIFTWPSQAIQSQSFAGIEYDIIEFNAGAMNLSDGAIHNWGVSGAPAGGWTGYGPPGLAGSHNPYVYHKYAMRTISDGTDMAGCWYIDGVFITCILAPGGLTTAEAVQREFLILQNACDHWNYGGSCPNQGGAPQHLYIKTMRVWSCSSWAATQCNRELVSDNLLPARTVTNATYSTGVSTPFGPGASLIENTTGAITHETSQFPYLSDLNYTISMRWKPVGTRDVSLYISDDTYTQAVGAYFNSSSCTVNTPSLVGSFTYSVAHAESLGGGWCLGYVTFRPNGNFNGTTYVALNSGGTNIYAGNGTSGVQFYSDLGPELKLGNYQP